MLSIVFLQSGITKVFAQTASSGAVDARKAQLQAQLDALEQQIKDQQVVLDQKKGETASIQRDISILDAKIAEAKLEIKKANVLIEQLGSDINVKSKTINVLSGQIDENQQSLAQLIKKTNEIDTTSLAEIMLGNQGISEFFSDADSIEVIKSSLFDVYEATKSNRQLTQAQKDDLDKRKSAAEDARQLIVTEQNNIQSDEAQKQKLLNLSKTQQNQYQTVLDSQKKLADSIRSALFALRDSASIPFGTALDYANFAYKQTGVLPAFILAILTQESNLGANIGTCNRASDPPEKHWQAIMPGPADIAAGTSKRNDEAAYLRITSALGLNPDTMPLSCPWNNGWGGAMGPSQFIPTTWESYGAALANLLGKTTANPWEPKDAIMATAYYMKQLGADAQTFTAQRTAALKYYAGSNWSKPANAFYGDQVMVKVQNIQTNMIDPLQNN